MAISTFDLFKIGIGPSSSHTVGPMLAAKSFADDIQQQGLATKFCSVRSELFGSLGLTGLGHGAGKAILLGLEGEHPQTVDIETMAERVSAIHQQGVITICNRRCPFEEGDLVYHTHQSLPYHPNGMRFSAHDRAGELLFQRIYYSVGGGFVLDEAQAKQDALLVEDQQALPYPFGSAAELLQQCQESKLDIAALMLENEKVWRDLSDIEQQLDTIWQVMQACVERGCQQQGMLPGGLSVARRAYNLYQKLQARANTLKDPLQLLDWVSLYALAVNEENASGGRVVTAPTNGAAGIIPAVLHYYVNFVEGADTEGIHRFLLTAAAIGILFKKNASISGAEVGCQGEVGSACSMASAGLCAVLGGSIEQIEYAAEIAMEHHLGLTCDPVGGLVQVPCIERNAVAAVQAIHATRMALQHEGDHFVSLDKVINTMRETGKDMSHKYKETALGGLAEHALDVPVNLIEC